MPTGFRGHLSRKMENQFSKSLVSLSSRVKKIFNLNVKFVLTRRIEDYLCPHEIALELFEELQESDFPCVVDGFHQYYFLADRSDHQQNDHQWFCSADRSKGPCTSYRFSFFQGCWIPPFIGNRRRDGF